MQKAPLRRGFFFCGPARRADASVPSPSQLLESQRAWQAIDEFCSAR
jgi:hypothetical protein